MTWQLAKNGLAFRELGAPFVGVSMKKFPVFLQVSAGVSCNTTVAMMKLTESKGRRYTARKS